MSRALQRYYGPLRHPPGCRRLPGAHRLYGGVLPTVSGQGGLLQFRCPPSGRSAPLIPAGSSGLRFQALRPFHGLRRDTRGSAPAWSLTGCYHGTAGFACWLRTDQLLPPTGLLTFRFDARRFPLTPGTCYRAPWRLPGPDSHRLADISLRLMPQATAALTSLRSPAALRLLDTRCAQQTARCSARNRL